MKLALIILVLIVQAHASFFDEFQNAMSSLQNGFQKLITDVVTDVKDTIDCTVIAVESALSFDVIANNPQNAKCNGASDEFININRSKSDDIERFSLEFLRDEPFEDTHESSRLDADFFKEIDVSISNVHGALNDVVNKKNVKSEKVENVNNSKNDNDHLNNVNVFLKNELDNMSSSIKDEIRRVNLNDESASDTAIKYINILHNIENNSKSSSDIKEVRRVLAGVSKILSINVKNNVSDGDKIIDILTKLERRLSNEKITNMQSHVSKWEVNNTLSDNSIKPVFHSKTFKDLFDKKLPLTTGADNVNNDNGNKNQNTEEMETSTENTSNSFKNTINDVDPLDYDSLFDDTLPLDKGEYHKETLEQAKNLIKDSQHTDSILNSYFAEVDHSGANVFDILNRIV